MYFPGVKRKRRLVSRLENLDTRFVKYANGRVKCRLGLARIPPPGNLHCPVDLNFGARRLGLPRRYLAGKNDLDSILFLPSFDSFNTSPGQEKRQLYR
jgi:hypothetical protein